MDDDDDSEQRFTCPITAYPCEGNLSYLCEEYGCARKGGLSPHSEENLRGVSLGIGHWVVSEMGH
jgi:hypothetical protein